MEFEYWVIYLFGLLFVMQVIFSLMEKTFFNDRGYLDLPLVWHWGVLIGDPILIIMDGFILNHMQGGWHSLLFLVISLVITWQLHKSWWDIRGHIFPTHTRSQDLAKVGWDSMTISERVQVDQKKYWYRDLSAAGVCHMIFFAVQLWIILEYIITSLPPSVVKTATVLLLIFSPFGVFVPGWAEWRTKRLRSPGATWFWRSFLSLLAMWAAIVIAYYCKI